jgi:hypothetical protein
MHDGETWRGWLGVGIEKGKMWITHVRGQQGGRWTQTGREVEVVGEEGEGKEAAVV